MLICTKLISRLAKDCVFDDFPKNVDSPKIAWFSIHKLLRRKLIFISILDLFRRVLRVVALQRQLTTKMSSLEQVLAQAEKLKGLEGDELAKLTDSLMDQLKTLKVEPAEKVFNRVLKHKAFGQFSRELQHRLLIFS